MAKLPVDVPKGRAIKTLELLGFRVVREREPSLIFNDGGNSGDDFVELHRGESS